MRRLKTWRWQWMLALVATAMIAVVFVRPVIGRGQVGPARADSAAARSVVAPGQRAEIAAAPPAAAPEASLDAQTRRTPTPALPESASCVACHTNQPLLAQMAQSATPAPAATQQADWVVGPLPTQEPWQRVFVDPAFISDDVHSQPGCTTCHGGTAGTLDMATAHGNLATPSAARLDKMCGSCHVGLVQSARTSSHRMLPDFVQALKARGADFTMPETVHAFNGQCAQCHATCADCHISRPAILGGGLTGGHLMSNGVAQEQTCAGCHNATVNAESTGAHEGIQGDVHAAAGMSCTDCHGVETFHQSQRAASQSQSVACVDCHQQDVKLGGANVQHTVHVNTVQCQVCHSAGAYTSCATCHAGENAQGEPTAASDPARLTFKIGRNAAPDENAPWNYVLVRQTAADPDMWAFYGENLLPDFASVPTWHPTTPHNVQKLTPQNATCNNCHGQSELFLTAEDVSPETLEANRGVIVPRIPPTRLEVAP